MKNILLMVTLLSFPGFLIADTINIPIGDTDTSGYFKFSYSNVGRLDTKLQFSNILTVGALFVLTNTPRFHISHYYFLAFFSENSSDSTVFYNFDSTLEVNEDGNEFCHFSLTSNNPDNVFYTLKSFPQRTAPIDTVRYSDHETGGTYSICAVPQCIRKEKVMNAPHIISKYSSRRNVAYVKKRKNENEMIHMKFQIFTFLVEKDSSTENENVDHFKLAWAVDADGDGDFDHDATFSLKKEEQGNQAIVPFIDNHNRRLILPDRGYSVSIFNPMGQRVVFQPKSDTRFTNLSNIGVGFYLLRINIGTEIYTNKILIE